MRPLVSVTRTSTPTKYLLRHLATFIISHGGGDYERDLDRDLWIPQDFQVRTSFNPVSSFVNMAKWYINTLCVCPCILEQQVVSPVAPMDRQLIVVNKRPNVRPSTTTAVPGYWYFGMDLCLFMEYGQALALV